MVFAFVVNPPSVAIEWEKFAGERSEKTQIQGDGLRYSRKANGSPFKGNGNTRSCFKCGAHRTSDQLKSFRIAGKAEMVCKPSCKELAAMPA